MSRYEVRPFSADSIPAAAELLAERHRRHRAAWPALNPAYADAAAVEPLIAGLLERDGAAGAVAYSGVEPAAYVLGAPRPDPSWGANVWIEDAGSAANEPEALRLAYASAADSWVADGRTQHYVVTPATDEPVVDAWFRLSFGLQAVHAVRAPATAGFQPTAPTGLVVRPATHDDIPALVELDPVLPRHLRGSPVFSPLSLPDPDESLADIEQDLNDPRFAPFVAEYRGRVVGTATACSIEESHGNTVMMRPPSCGFLGYAVVLPQARGLGAGRALGETVLAWSRDEGYDWVATDWRSANLEADRIWRAMGFRPVFYRLHRSIV